MKKPKRYSLLLLALLALAGCSGKDTADAVSHPENVPGAGQETSSPVWQPPAPPARETLPPQLLNSYDPEQPLHYGLSSTESLSREENPGLFENIHLLLERRQSLEQAVMTGGDSSDGRRETPPKNGSAPDGYDLFVYEDVHSLADLKSLFETVYTEEFVREDISPRYLEQSGDHPLFAEHGENLYRAWASGIPSSLDLSRVKIHRRLSSYIVTCEVSYAASEQAGLYVGILREDDEKPFGFAIEMEFIIV